MLDSPCRMEYLSFQSSTYDCRGSEKEHQYCIGGRAESVISRMKEAGREMMRYLDCCCFDLIEEGVGDVDLDGIEAVIMY